MSVLAFPLQGGRGKPQAEQVDPHDAPIWSRLDPVLARRESNPHAATEDPLAICTGINVRRHR
eukprot:scaffold76174_cov41-Prasinocladus_malaysianus.AAC.1